MIRIILGILLLLGVLSNLGRPDFALPDNRAEALGYILGAVVFFIFSIWLIYSGFKKRKQKEKNNE